MDASFPPFGRVARAGAEREGGRGFLLAWGKIRGGKQGESRGKIEKMGLRKSNAYVAAAAGGRWVGGRGYRRQTREKDGRKDHFPPFPFANNLFPPPSTPKTQNPASRERK